MNRRIRLLLLIVLSTSACATAQIPYDDVAFGGYGIGYCDTLLLDTSDQYDAFGYEGPRPYFVQIWHPTPPMEPQQQKTAAYLRLSDLHRQRVTDRLQPACDTLVARMDWALLTYGFSENIETGEPLVFDTIRREIILRNALSSETRSRRTPLPDKVGYPIVVYHHGAQGLRDENFLMAEYLASHGFVVVSANFHWPYPGLEYGMEPGQQDAVHQAKFIEAFARSLSPEQPLMYVGHSWGAQIGLLHLWEDGAADAFVSLETTIEWQTNEAKIRDFWGPVHEVVHVQKRRFDLPVLLVGAGGRPTEFPFFAPLKARGALEFSSRNEVHHEAYTAVFFLRDFAPEMCGVPDHTALSEQWDQYLLHLELIKSFLQAAAQQHGNAESFTFDTAPWQEHFYIH